MQEERKGVLVINRSTRLTVLVYVLIYFSRDTLIFGTNGNSIARAVPLAVMGAYIAWESLRIVSRKRISGEKTVIISGIILLAIFFCHKEQYQAILVRTFCIISAMLLVLHYRFDEFAEAFTKSLLFCVVCALLLEVIAYTPLLSFCPVIINTADTPCWHIVFAALKSNLLSRYAFVRACGIFWEPGVFQLYLNLAVMFELFRCHVINWKRVGLLTVGVIITFSTAGYIVLGWIYIVYLFLCRKEGISIRAVITLLALLIGVVIMLLFIDLSVVFEGIFGKLQAGHAEYGSMISRTASIVANLRITYEHPLIGVGIKSMNDVFLATSTQMDLATPHNTNTLLYLFSAHGIFYGLIVSVGTYRFTYCFTGKKILRYAVFATLLLMYVDENLSFSMLPYIIMFYGYRAKKFSRVTEREYVSVRA